MIPVKDGIGDVLCGELAAKVVPIDINMIDATEPYHSRIADIRISDRGRTAINCHIGLLATDEVGWEELDGVFRRPLDLKLATYQKRSGLWTWIEWIVADRTSLNLCSCGNRQRGLRFDKNGATDDPKVLGR